MKHNPPRHSSNSLNSQASMTLQATSQPGAGKGKSRKRKDQSPPSPSLPDGNSVVQQQPCSLAIPITSSFSKPANKQGFRFSLRRMLYNSPLVSQRRSRSLSGGNNLSNPAPSSSSTGGLRKRQSPCTCEFLFISFNLMSAFVHFYARISCCLFPHSSIWIWKPLRYLQHISVRAPCSQQISQVSYIWELGMPSVLGRMLQRILSRVALLHASVVPRLHAAVLANRNFRVTCQHQLPRMLGAYASQWWMPTFLFLFNNHANHEWKWFYISLDFYFFVTQTSEQY